MRLLRHGLACLFLCSAFMAPARAESQSSSLSPATSPFRAVDCTTFARRLLADRCGYVAMPEDRAKPRGRVVQIAVTIFKSALPSPNPDPVIYLSGGPAAPR